MTGFSGVVRAAILERCGGICEICGMNPIREMHHRRPRGMGGTVQPGTDWASNGLGLCAGCHRLAEGHRNVARLCGWLVAQYDDPMLVPVIRRGIRVFLTDDGGCNGYSE